MSPSTEYLKRYHSRGIAIFMNYFFNLKFCLLITFLITSLVEFVRKTKAKHVVHLFEWNSIYNKIDMIIIKKHRYRLNLG